MSGSAENWRPETDAGDYFLHRQKKLDLADRRPVIRRASDLVGPGIGTHAVRITDYNDLLATFNGYYSSVPGALSAPNATESFVGHVISDAAFGGRQVFTGLTSGIEYSRNFTRSPTDPETVGWTAWVGQRIPAYASGVDGSEVDTLIQPATTYVLPPPMLTTRGEVGVYERTDAGINIRKQGIYTGHIQVGDREQDTDARLYFLYPVGDATTYSGQVHTPLAQTVHIPFTVHVTDDQQSFGLKVYSDTALARTVWWRFACTRVGDAV